MKLQFSNQGIRNKLSQYKVPVLYSGGAITKSVVQMLVGFIVAKFVTPEDLGIWGTLNLSVTYAGFLQAGLISGLNRELPYALGEGNTEEANKLAGTTQMLTVAAALFVLLIGIPFSFLYRTDSPKITYGILAVVFFIAITFYQNYLSSTFRSKNSFLKLSYIQVINALVNLVTVLLVVYFSYYGMIVKAVIVLGFYALQLHLARPMKVGLIWDKKAFLKLMATGLPLFLFGYIESIASTADKVWLLNISGVESVGYYTFAFYAYTLFVVFSSTIASYIYPRMTYQFGQHQNGPMLWKYVRKTTTLLFLIQVPLVVVGYLVIPFLIVRLFPTYIPSSTAMQVLLIAGMLRGCVVGANAMMSIKAWKEIIIYQSAYSILLVLLPYLGIRLFDDVVLGAAVGLTVANLINVFSGLILTYLATAKTKK